MGRLKYFFEVQNDYDLCLLGGNTVLTLCPFAIFTLVFLFSINESRSMAEEKIY